MFLSSFVNIWMIGWLKIFLYICYNDKRSPNRSKNKK